MPNATSPTKSSPLPAITGRIGNHSSHNPSDQFPIFNELIPSNGTPCTYNNHKIQLELELGLIVRRIVSVAAALILSAAGAGAAKAAPATNEVSIEGTKTIEFSQSTARSVVDFWTPDRLRQAAENAQPVPTITAEAARRAHEKAERNQKKTQQGGPVAADSVAPERQNKAAASPMATSATIADRSYSDLASPLGPDINITGRLFYTVGDRLGSCTAAGIVSNNKNSIWTAGHCLHSGGKSGSFHSNFLFAPGYDETAPWGYWPLRTGVVSAGWSDDADLLWSDIAGGIVFPNSQFGNLQDWLGAYGYQFNGNTDINNVTSLGYPSDGYNRTSASLHDGAKPMYCHGTAVDAGNWNPLDNRLKLACDMGHGASGGPQIVNFGGNNQIVGANSHRLVDANNNFVENYLYSSNHGSAAVGVINWLNAH
ncbi:trypsin-like serine peptidase [Kitasatospora sp. NPDC092286]|uniref:trypsin-like serine peptidase n=1 Tax=Kitasatospora sp. NPDC092286 TaxID=3364087 RepID=UPI003828A204